MTEEEQIFSDMEFKQEFDIRSWKVRYANVVFLLTKTCYDILNINNFFLFSINCLNTLVLNILQISNFFFNPQ